MRKAKPKENASGANLLLAVCLLTAFAGASAFASAYIAGVVLDLLQSRDALVMIVTDAGIKSDSVSVEQGLSAATMALKSVRDLGWALAVGCVGVGGGGLHTLPPSKRLLGQARGVFGGIQRRPRDCLGVVFLLSGKVLDEYRTVRQGH